MPEYVKLVSVTDWRNQLSAMVSRRGDYCMVMTSGSGASLQYVPAVLSVAASAKWIGCRLGAISLLMSSDGAQAQPSHQSLDRMIADSSGDGGLAVCLPPKGWHTDIIWERFLACDELLSNRFCRVRIGWYHLDSMVMSVGRNIDWSGRQRVVAECVSLMERGHIEECGFRMWEECAAGYERMMWVKSMLSAAVSISRTSSRTLSSLLAILGNEKQWSHGRKLFERIRGGRSDHGACAVSELVLDFAELAAKVAFNESASVGMFDRDSGWHLLPALYKLGGRVGGDAHANVVAAAFGFGDT